MSITAEVKVIKTATPASATLQEQINYYRELVDKGIAKKQEYDLARISTLKNEISR